MKNHYLFLMLVVSFSITAMDSDSDEKESISKKNVNQSLDTLLKVGEQSLKNKFAKIIAQAKNNPKEYSAFADFIDCCVNNRKFVRDTHADILSNHGLCSIKKDGDSYPVDFHLQELTVKLMQEGLDFEKLSLEDSTNTKAAQTQMLPLENYTK